MLNRRTSLALVTTLVFAISCGVSQNSKNGTTAQNQTVIPENVDAAKLKAEQEKLPAMVVVKASEKDPKQVEIYHIQSDVEIKDAAHLDQVIKTQGIQVTTSDNLSEGSQESWYYGGFSYGYNSRFNYGWGYGAGCLGGMFNNYAPYYWSSCCPSYGWGYGYGCRSFSYRGYGYGMYGRCRGSYGWI